MKAKSTEDFETKEKLIRNCMNIKTGWQDNHKLHPEGNKSSKDLYIEKHLNGNSIPLKKSLFINNIKTIFEKSKTY